jgi:hypothetical protein
MRLRAAALAFVCGALAVGFGSSSTTRVPDVRFMSFPLGLAALRSAGLLIRVPYFPPFHNAFATQARGLLANYEVVGQAPPAGSLIQPGTSVTLLVSLRRFEGPFGSLSLPARHAATTTVPRLVGLSYADFFSGTGSPAGVWGRLGYTAPVDRLRSLEELRISDQEPKAGTVVPYLGIHPRVIKPNEATVTVDLGDRSRAIRVDQRARRALRSALASPAGRAWLQVTRADRPRPAAEAVSYGCYLGHNIGGYCLTAVDPSARRPLVVFVVMWHDWHGPRAERKILHTRTWQVHVE